MKKMTFAKSFSPQPAGVPLEEENQASPVALLKNVMKEKNVTFESIKKKLEKENYEKVDKITKLENIPKAKIFELIDRMKQIKT